MKKFIALLLCLVMLFSLSSVAIAETVNFPTSAEYLSNIIVLLKKLIQSHIFGSDNSDTQSINYVALGDSTTVGFWLADYSYSHQHNGKYPVSGKFSEYSLFMDYLKSKYPNVTGTDLTMTGMRPIFLRAILSDSEFKKIANREASIFDTGFASHIGTIGGEYDDGGEYVNSAVAESLGIANAYNGMSGNDDSMREIFTAALKNANVISYDMFMIDTSINTLSAFSELDSTTATHKFADLMEEENYPEIAASANTLKLALQSVLKVGSFSDLSSGLVLVNNIIDTLLFIYADLAINFYKNMEWIYTNNENDPTVLIVMPSNYFPKIDVELGGITVSVTRLINCLLDAVNAYLISGNQYANRYTLVDCSDVSETCIAAYGQGVFNTEHEEYADYAMLWETTKGYLIDQKLAQLEDPMTFDQLTPSEQTQIKNNFAAACDSVYNPKNHVLIDITDFGSAFSDNPNNALFDGIDRSFYKTAERTDLINYSRDDDPVSDADKCALVLDLGDILLMGIHPSAKCCVDKVKAIEDAFSSAYPASSYYCVRLTNFAFNLFGSAVGIEASKNAVSTAIERYCTPIIDLSGLKAAKAG